MVMIILTAYFPVAGVAWVGIERLIRRRLTRAQMLARLIFPPVAAAIIGIGEIIILVAFMSYLSLFLLWVFTITVPGVFWIVPRLILKDLLGIPLRSDLRFELLMTSVGFISGKSTSFLLFNFHGNPLL
jgi:hypothetical protein